MDAVENGDYRGLAAPPVQETGREALRTFQCRRTTAFQGCLGTCRTLLTSTSMSHQCASLAEAGPTAEAKGKQGKWPHHREPAGSVSSSAAAHGHLQMGYEVGFC